MHAIKIVRASYIAFITEAPCRRGDTVIACCRRVRACVCGYACECSSAFRYTHMWNRIPHTLDFPVNYVLMHSSPAPTASMAAGSVCGGCFFVIIVCMCVIAFALVEGNLWHAHNAINLLRVRYSRDLRAVRWLLGLCAIRTWGRLELDNEK